MSIGIRFGSSETDLDEVLAPLPSGATAAANTNIKYGSPPGSDLSSRYAPASLGTPYGTTGIRFGASETDVGDYFAKIGSLVTNLTVTTSDTSGTFNFYTWAKTQTSSFSPQVNITVNSGVILVNPVTGTFPSSSLTIINNGAMEGSGGRGGAGGNAGATNQNPGGAGSAGGDGLGLGMNLTLNNSNGVIYGGSGGGGGGGGQANASLEGYGGGGGGGGVGYPEGVGGKGGSGGANNGTSGTNASGTTGGSGGLGGGGGAGNGGKGGSGWATAGTSGSSGGAGPGTGGAAGYGIRKNGYTLNLTGTGTIIGTVG